MIPEVSSLDYSNALTTSGGTVPGLATRRIETEIELENGQSFAIAGLLNNQTTESLSKIPGLGDIPLFGKLFQTKTINKQNSELLILVTPEFVEPIPQDQKLPELTMPQSFLEGAGCDDSGSAPRESDKTGAPPPRPARAEISVQEMEQLQLLEKTQNTSGVGLRLPRSTDGSRTRGVNAAPVGGPAPPSATQ